MAFVNTDMQAGHFGWIRNGTCTDASGCEEFMAAVPGKSIICDHITISNGAGAQSITIGEDENAGAVKKALIGPIAMAVNTSIQWGFPSGMVLAVNTALVVDSSSNTALTIFAYGRVE
jgi:hypothetical protein